MEGEQSKRIWMIDVARFLGIALVYYGHFIERIMYLENSSAAVHYKFIYSFHMPLFFVLAGFIARESTLKLPLGAYLKQRLVTRILPFIFFNLLMIVLTFFVPGYFFHLDLPSLEGYGQGLLLSLFGLTLFNVPTWFLLCLFSVELVHYIFFRYIRTDRMIIAAALFFYAGGYYLNATFDIFNPMKGRVVGWNYWFIHEALVVYAFYLLGIYLRRKRFLMDHVSLRTWLTATTLLLLVVLFTFSLNTGPFDFYDSVVIMLSSHGNVLFFPLTAAAGSLLILFLARGSANKPRIIAFMGQNALILFCLNGIFYHFVNPPLAQLFVDTFSGSPWSVFAAGTVVTLVSMGLCLPLIYLFNRFVPQFVGRPRIKGPVFKNFL